MFGVLAFVVEATLMLLEPAYRTYKGLEATETDGGTVDPAEWRRLLVHWIVYGAFRAVESLARPWVPFYDVLKIAAIVWMRAGGSETVYQSIIRPFLVENEPAIDQWMDQLNRTRDTVMTASSALSAAVTADPDTADEGDSDEVQSDPTPAVPVPVTTEPGEKEQRKEK